MAAPASDQWRAWVSQNLLQGAPAADLHPAMLALGLSAEQANKLLTEVQADPIFRTASALLTRSTRLTQAAALMRERTECARFEQGPLDELAFKQGFWDAHRPVVSRGLAASWPACQWTHASLAQRAGDAEVSVLVGRSKHQRWWTLREQLTQRMSLAALCELSATTISDDVYAVARNDLLAEPLLAGLLDELGPLPGIQPDAMHARLWVGPQGTLTPLHHDQSSAWLVQVTGKKRVWLASPLEPALHDTVDGVFNTIDPRAPTDTGIAWLSCELSPGDAVFLPAGWWHQVEATAPSISISLGGFRWPHVVTWYAPGRPAHAQVAPDPPTTR